MYIEPFQALVYKKQHLSRNNHQLDELNGLAYNKQKALLFH